MQRVDNSPEEEMKLEVFESDRSFLKDKLDLLKFSLFDFEAVPVVFLDILHGLTDDVIKDIVKNCDILFTPDDVMKNFPIWSYEKAIQVCSVICEDFADFGPKDLHDEDSD